MKIEFDIPLSRISTGSDNDAVAVFRGIDGRLNGGIVLEHKEICRQARSYQQIRADATKSARDLASKDNFQ